MEYLPIVIIFMLLAAVFCLLAKLLFLRKDFEVLVKDVRHKLRTETNTPLTTSSSDRTVRRLAAELNTELTALRTKKLLLDTGNTELQNAVTYAAHDLRTPLTSINGYLELLEEEDLNDKAAEYCGVIRERTETLKALTEELFQFSVMKNTADEIEIKPVNLNRELEIALAAAYQPLSDAGITPEIHIPKEPIIRELDQKALQRIFGNILNNAAKYASGKLSVTIEPDGTIIFSNPAPSLSEVEVEKLFDRYYTVENAKGATGLGLSIAKLLTERMGGQIKADYVTGEFNLLIQFMNRTAAGNRIQE